MATSGAHRRSYHGNIMIARQIVFLSLLASVSPYAWVKVADFYDIKATVGYDELHKSDLVVILATPWGNTVRIPLKGIGYYSLSDSWIPVNETTYFGRLSYFTKDNVNRETENTLVKFKGNTTLGADHRAVVTLIKNQLYTTGYLCRVGKPSSTRRTTVNVCLHDLLGSGISPKHVFVTVKAANCKDCAEYVIATHGKQGNLEFTVPEARVWNVTLTYRAGERPTTLCRFIHELRSDDMNIVIMKRNNTVSTMFECVFFVDDVYSSPMDVWIPIIAALVSLLFVCLAAFIIYKKCKPSCIKNLLPAPDPDTAPYRSFNSSNQSDTTNDDDKYMKMRHLSVSSTPAYVEHDKASRTGFSPEPHYERI